MAQAPHSSSLTLSNLVSSSHGSRVRNSDIRDQSLVRIATGFYLPADCVDSRLQRWELRREVSIARSLAVASSFDDANPALLTMESALAVWDIGTWSNVTDIEFWRSDHPLRMSPRTAPPIELHNQTTCGVKIRELQGKRLGEQHSCARGIRTVPLLEAAVDLARYAHPLIAWVGVSNSLRYLCGFDKFNQLQSRKRADAIRQQMLQLLGLAGNVRGTTRATAIINGVDPGCESPGEAAFLWLLSVVLRSDKSKESRFHTQFPVKTQERHHFLDVGFPGIRLAGEFDGASKTVANLDLGRQWIDRQYALEDAGWRMLRFSTERLNDPWRLAIWLAEELGKHGLKAQPPGGPLWKPVPARLLDPLRRF